VSTLYYTYYFYIYFFDDYVTFGRCIRRPSNIAVVTHTDNGGGDGGRSSGGNGGSYGSGGGGAGMRGLIIISF
jgi:uncharacterized membrane protein YgcG